MKYNRVLTAPSGVYLRQAHLCCAYQELRAPMLKKAYRIRRDRLATTIAHMAPTRDWLTHIRGPEPQFPQTFNDYMWQALCFALTTAEKKSVLMSSTDKEPEWQDLLLSCPHVKLLDETKARVGNYQVQIWLITKGKK